jgi:malate synthase
MTTQTESVRITATPPTPSQSQVLTPEATEFLLALHTRFEPIRQQRLQERVQRQKRLDAGEKPQFLEATRSTREAEWKVAPIPSDLRLAF